MERLARRSNFGALVLAFAFASPSPVEAATTVTGDARSVSLTVQASSVDEVMKTLSETYGMNFRTSVSLDRPRDGLYEGTLSRVVLRVLEGYNFFVKNVDGKLEVVVVSARSDVVIARNDMASVRRDIMDARRDVAATASGSQQGATSDSPNWAPESPSMQNVGPSVLPDAFSPSSIPRSNLAINQSTTAANQSPTNAYNTRPPDLASGSGSGSYGRNARVDAGGGSITEAEFVAMNERAAAFLEEVRTSLAPSSENQPIAR